MADAVCSSAQVSAVGYTNERREISRVCFSRVIRKIKAAECTLEWSGQRCFQYADGPIVWYDEVKHTVQYRVLKKGRSGAELRCRGEKLWSGALSVGSAK